FESSHGPQWHLINLRPNIFHGVGDSHRLESDNGNVTANKTPGPDKGAMRTTSAQNKIVCATGFGHRQSKFSITNADDCNDNPADHKGQCGATRAGIQEPAFG